MNTEQDFYFHVSLNSRFFVEKRALDAWTMLPEVSLPYGASDPPGLFFWIWEQAKRVSLFWGEDSLFAMRTGFPPDRDRSALCGRIEAHWRDEYSEHNVCWLPAEELLLDDWPDTLLTVGQDVPARDAGLFGNGQALFPSAALLAAGYTADDCQRLQRSGLLTASPVDQTFGKPVWERRSLPPDTNVPVTWQENVDAYLGAEGAAAFHGLRRFGRDEYLRIVVFSTP